MDKTVFLDFVGYTPRMKILEVLIEGRGFDYSLSDLARAAEISWTTLHRVFPQLEKQGFVVKTRQVGQAKLYKLNMENKSVKLWVKLYKSLLLNELDKVEQKSIIKAIAR